VTWRTRRDYDMHSDGVVSNFITVDDSISAAVDEFIRNPLNRFQYPVTT
jgi:hypothetical protein